MSDKHPAFTLDKAQVAASEAWELIQAHRGKPGFTLLDVRTAAEIRDGHILGMEPLDYYAPGFQGRLDALPKDVSYLVFCHTGARSGQTVAYLRSIGHETAYNMLGGLAAWTAMNLPLEMGE